MGKTVFDLKNSKTNLIKVSLQFLLFNKLKNIFCFRWKLKKFEHKICFPPHFRVVVQFFWRHYDQGKRQHKDMKFWNWGTKTIWHNIESLAFFLSSKSLHPIVRVQGENNKSPSNLAVWKVTICFTDLTEGRGFLLVLQ